MAEVMVIVRMMHWENHRATDPHPDWRRLRGGQVDFLRMTTQYGQDGWVGSSHERYRPIVVEMDEHQPTVTW